MHVQTRIFVNVLLFRPAARPSSAILHAPGSPEHSAAMSSGNDANRGTRSGRNWSSGDVIPRMIDAMTQECQYDGDLGQRVNDKGVHRTKAGAVDSGQMYCIQRLH